MGVRRIAVCLLALILIASVADASGNLLKNPGFEDGLGANGVPAGGWWVYKTEEGQPDVTVDAAVAHQGKCAVRLSAQAASKFTAVSAPFSVTPNDDIKFEAFVRGQGLRGGEDSIGIALSFRDRDGKVFDRNWVYPEKLPSGSWVHLSGAANVPANAVTGEIFLQFNRAVGTVWYDSVSAVVANTVSMTLAEAPKPYVGEQMIAVVLANRSDKSFSGSLKLTLGKQVSDTPASVAAGSESRIPLKIDLRAVGKHEYSLELFDASGAPERKIAGSFNVAAPLTIYPACPCYHAIGEGDGSTRVDVRISLHPDRLRGAKLEVRVSDSAGNALDTGSVDASGGGLVGRAFKVPVNAEGDFTATIKLLDADGREMGGEQCDIHVRPRSASRVTMGEDGYPRVNGKSQFPLGLYSAGRFPEMGEAGFSFNHSYQIVTGDAEDPINPTDIRLKDLLDRSAEAGLRMLVELPRKAVEQGKWEQVRRRIETFRNHPGLGFWGSEERVARGEGPLKHIEGAYRIVKEMDPNHPFVLGDTYDVITNVEKDRSRFFPESMMDIGIWWFYPIPMEPIPDTAAQGQDADVTFTPPTWLANYAGEKPLWIAVQCYKKPRIDGRYPTRAEYRQMCYMPIVHGAKGVAFYTGSGQPDYYKKPSGILNNPEEGDWEYIKQLIREMRDLNPVLTAPTVDSLIDKSPADALVDFIVKDVDGKFVMIAVNRANKRVRISLAGPGVTGTKVEVHNENRTLPVSDNSFTDTFEPYAVHVYMLGR